MKNFFLILFVILFSGVLSASPEEMSKQERENFLRNKITMLDSNYEDAKIIPTKSPLFYLIVSNSGKKIYITKDGNHLIMGSVFKNVDNKLLVDLENDMLREHRRSVLEKIDKSLLVKFPATSEHEADLFVFSDISCPYCKKKHKHLDIIRKAGFDVYYIPYPRMGMNKNKNAVIGLKNIMCSDDSAAEFDEAFKNPENYVRNVNNNNIECEDSKLLKDFYRLGDVMGVEGTPATFLEDGGYISGFSSPQSFLRDLKREYAILKRNEVSENGGN